jgi:deazaflavin-dependent oxidoreductase (nitroreductase family)
VNIGDGMSTDVASPSARLTTHRRLSISISVTPAVEMLPMAARIPYLRDGDNLIVCKVRPPGERRNPWPLNVRANANVTIRIGGVAETRVARDARPEELERLWLRLVALWPPYERFFARTQERAIFVLELPGSHYA